MPLPLPNLDTRRWADLVEEGRALIPQYAPSWTDHNVHDPGITLMELLAWIVEQEMYRANRVTDRHRRKFLALAGFPVRPPRGARVALAFSPSGNTPVALPALLTFSTTGAGEGGDAAEPRRFRLTAPLTVLPAAVKGVQSFNGVRYVDRAREWGAARAFPAWGDDPRIVDPPDPQNPGPALYIGLDRALPAGAEFRLWLQFAGGRSGADERSRLIAEAQEQEVLCEPRRPRNLPGCQEPADEQPPPTPVGPLQHHSMAAAWEYLDGAAWQPLTAVDETRALTLDGAVLVTAPANMQPRALGVIAEELHYLRCRLVSGRPDAAPVVALMAANGVVAEQAAMAHSRLEVLPGVVPPAGQEPVPGQRQRLILSFDGMGRISALETAADGTGPEALVLDYQPATATASGSLACTLEYVGAGTGLPGQVLLLRGAPVADGACRLWLIGEAAVEEWGASTDLDSAGPADALFALDPATGAIVFGDGEHGRLPPAASAVVAAYATTGAADGNVAAGSRWRFLGADDLYNQALIATSPEALAASLGSISNPLPALGGVQEDIPQAAGRAAEALWAHERLLQVAPPGSMTLDQMDRAAVLSVRPPARATTQLDYERLALEVPGTALGRVRAWAGLDPQYPCLRAPGTVTVIIVPTLPAARPAPTPELITMVRRYLLRRRTVGTRLVVVGPQYVEVRARAAVRVRPRADAARAQADVVAALDAFLDPMSGGPDGRGWPFGRDVFRSEILQVIDSVPGVDYVSSLELFAGDDDAPCGNVCVGATALATPGQHQVEVS